MRRKLFGFIAVFPEVAVSHSNIPPIGRVTGILDYLIAHTGRPNPLTESAAIQASRPALAVIEAKRSDNVSQKGLIAQLLGQMICIQGTEFQHSYYSFLLKY
jgi:hypothetical protein